MTDFKTTLYSYKSYYCFIFVSCHTGTEIATIEARDADSGDFGKVTYLLDRMSSQVTDKLINLIISICCDSHMQHYRLTPIVYCLFL